MRCLWIIWLEGKTLIVKFGIMKIRSLRIQKFRSIDDSSIRIDQVLAIVGANNTGKSHVLRALNAFFNFSDEANSFASQEHAYSSKSRPRITVTFKDVEETDNVPSEYLRNDTLTIKFTYRWDRKTPTYEVDTANGTITISSEQFDWLMHGFRYIYVPINRSSDSAFSDEGGVAYKLLNSIVKQQIAKRNTLQPLVKSLYKKMEDTVLKNAVSKIKKYYPFNDDSDFQLLISDSDPIDIIIRNVTLELIESSQHNNLRNCGSGIQSAIYFAISLAASMNNGISYLVGIEEPELNMHPQAQRKLIESLLDTSRYPKTQFAITTHSTVVIDELGHQYIALCKKKKGDTRDIVTQIAQVGDDFWTKYQMVEERYTSFFEYKNSDFFFSDYIVITESPVDCGILDHVLKAKNLDTKNLGLAFIPANGEKNIKYPYAIAKELSIPFLCVVDRDAFQPYINDNRENSLDENGLPQYKNELKSSSPILDLIETSDKELIRDYFINGAYGNALAVLDRYSIVSMRFAIEMDLIACPSYIQHFYDKLAIPETSRTPRYLVTAAKKAIKKTDVINYVIDQGGVRNLPKSYKCIIKKVKEMIEQA